MRSVLICLDRKSLQDDISSVAFRYQDQPMKQRPALPDMDMLEII